MVSNGTWFHCNNHRLQRAFRNPMLQKHGTMVKKSSQWPFQPKLFRTLWKKDEFCWKSQSFSLLVVLPLSMRFIVEDDLVIMSQRPFVFITILLLLLASWNKTIKQFDEYKINCSVSNGRLWNRDDTHRHKKIKLIHTSTCTHDCRVHVNRTRKPTNKAMFTQ